MNRQANNMRNLRKVVENELSETENAERQINEDTSLIGYYITFREELDKVGSELQRIASAVAEAKAGYMSKVILSKEELKQLVTDINAKSRDYTVVFPAETH